MSCIPCEHQTRSFFACPIRPGSDSGTAEGNGGWNNFGDGPIEALEGEVVETVNAEDEASGDDGEAARIPRGLPEAYAPPSVSSGNSWGPWDGQGNVRQ